ncbi:cell wall-binding repeat-containing protein [Agromyces mangrovi Wang et al. 2018]|uniref:cell wall-binding repeat-containing protein n=1 Tax=Agromyces mangrovi TaxID=1858653 RepID=UPI002573D2CB|nr:cell wall-binding repeat-containing protein [Agromyces mangrovi]BDZ63821.1 hypothetical protein GCM10025877_07590 [Agromyces mangrovi]
MVDIVGTVSQADGAPVADMMVVRYGVRSSTGSLYRYSETYTDASGQFRFTAQAGTSVTFEFRCTGTWCAEPYVTEWLGDARTADEATILEIPESGEVLLDVEVSTGASISGVVTNIDGEGIPGVFIEGDGFGSSNYTDDDGRYEVTGLWHGDHVIEFIPPEESEYLGEWWNDAYTESRAEPLTLAPDESYAGADVVLSRGATISGLLLDHTGEPLEGSASIYLDEETRWSSPETNIFLPGEGYIFRDVRPGTYTAVFGASSAGHVSQWFGGMPERADAELFEVSDGEHVQFDTVLWPERASMSEPRFVEWPRVGAAARVEFSSPTPGVEFSYQWYVSSQPIPGATDAEFVPGPEHAGRLLRVRVFASAPGYATFADNSPSLTVDDPRVQRLSGDDRYETSATISSTFFSPGVPVVYVASGTKFPDSLSAAAPALLVDAPVLLTKRDSLPSVTASEIDRLAPERIVVLGGEASVGASVESALADLAPGGVTRLAGADRFETSAAISRATYEPGVPVAYVASGTSFPDALSAAPLTVRWTKTGPILLVKRDSIPTSVADELRRLRPGCITVLGGPAVVDLWDELREFASPPCIGVLAGENRYETSTIIADRLKVSTCPSSVAVAYVASGTSFPDALSIAPVTRSPLAPILLTSRGRLPATTEEWIRRCAPDEVFIVGGPATVSDDVGRTLTDLLAEIHGD